VVVCVFLSNQLCEGVIEHGGLLRWLPDYFLWGFIKDCVCRPSVPQCLPELWGQISYGCWSWCSSAAVHMEGLSIPLICHVTCGIHIEYASTDLEHFSLYIKLFDCCNCSGALNIASFNYLIHFETSVYHAVSSINNTSVIFSGVCVMVIQGMLFPNCWIVISYNKVVWPTNHEMKWNF
jgi:hypothetical protein